MTCTPLPYNIWTQSVIVMEDSLGYLESTLTTLTASLNEIDIVCTSGLQSPSTRLL